MGCSGQWSRLSTREYSQALGTQHEDAAHVVDAPANTEAGSAAQPAYELDPSVPRSPRLIDVFLRAGPEQLSALQLAIQAREIDRVKQLAHKFKGSCLSLGAPQLAALAHAVEDAAAQGRIDESAVAQLAPGLTVILGLLQQLRASARKTDVGR